MTRDWVEWHRAYDDPSSSLSQRLVVVSRMVRGALDRAASGPITVLSLCAGDARDLALAAADHPRAGDLTGVLVELDRDLAASAATNVASIGVRIVVRGADAGAATSFQDVLPVDLLLLCGIFGNVPMDDIRTTIAAVPAMCRPGATVIWTRHGREPDATPSIRRWFDETGCTELEFVSPTDGSFGVGSARCADSMTPAELPDRLFTFRDDLW